MNGWRPLGFTEQHGFNWPHIHFRVHHKEAILIRTPLFLRYTSWQQSLTTSLTIRR